MDELIQMLEQIYHLLEQVYGITVNQATIFLEMRHQGTDFEEALEMIESMVSYKDELIDQLTEIEKSFDAAYVPYRGKITDTDQVKLFKGHVEKILALKKQITDAEQNNVVLMNSIMKERERKIEIPKQPSKVVAAYQKQQRKSE